MWAIAYALTGWSRFFRHLLGALYSDSYSPRPPFLRFGARLRQAHSALFTCAAFGPCRAVFTALVCAFAALLRFVADTTGFRSGAGLLGWFGRMVWRSCVLALRARGAHSWWFGLSPSRLFRPRGPCPAAPRGVIARCLRHVARAGCRLRRLRLLVGVTPACPWAVVPVLRYTLRYVASSLVARLRRPLAFARRWAQGWRRTFCALYVPGFLPCLCCRASCAPPPASRSRVARRPHSPAAFLHRRASRGASLPRVTRRRHLAPVARLAAGITIVAASSRSLRAASRFLSETLT